MTTVQHHAPLGAVTILRVVDFVKSLTEQMQARREARITRKALAQLSDHQLNDVGLTRAYIKTL